MTAHTRQVLCTVPARHSRRMSAALAPVVALAVLGSSALASSAAAAQEQAPAPPPPALRDTQRFRFGIGWHFGVVSAGGSAGLGALGAYVRVGAQFTDLISAELQASGSSLIFGGYFRSNAYFDMTFAHRVSVAVGPLFAITQGAGFGASPGSMVGGSLRLGFHVPRNHYPDGVRSSMNFGVEGDLGPSVDLRTGSVVSVAGGVTFFLGYQRD